MKRKALTNTQWERLQPLLPSQKPTTGRPASDHRVIINGIMWILRTGAPWRDLPERYGPWGTVASRFYRWRKAGIWARLFAAVQQRADAAEQLVLCHSFIVGYTDFSFVRASSIFICQSTPRCVALTSFDQADVSSRRLATSPQRRSATPWRVSELSACSAMFSQLPCGGG